jgi:predicted acyltransferase
MNTDATTSDTSANKPADTPVRLMSLDALRGFDMFWILGADALVRALDRMSDNAVIKFFATQLSHQDWAGFHFYDLIFPLFVFIAGVSSVYSLTKETEKHGRAGACRRVVRRGLLIVLFGIFYSGGLTYEWPNIRLLGVLQRIGLAYLFAGLLFLYFKPRALIGICAGLLIGYWAIMTFTPIRNIQLETAALAKRATDAGDAQTAALFKEGVNPSASKISPVWAATEKMFNDTTERVTGKFDKGFNLSNHLDFQFLAGRKYDLYWDPEGLLSTLPAIATCLLGIFAGLLIRSAKFCDKWKLIYLVSFGVAGVLLGFLWGMQFPVVKKIWTSSFVLVAGGYSALLLAAFYLVVDVWKCQRWCQPFVWIGMNSITVYVANNIIGFRKLADRFAAGDVKVFLDANVAKGFGDLMLAFVSLGLGVLLCWFLHRKKIFLRL